MSNAWFRLHVLAKLSLVRLSTFYFHLEDDFVSQNEVSFFFLMAVTLYCCCCFDPCWKLNTFETQLGTSICNSDKLIKKINFKLQHYYIFNRGPCNQLYTAKNIHDVGDVT